MVLNRFRADAVRDERGAVAVVVALLVTVLVVMVALVVDLGMSRDMRRQSQNAADASALAGVNALYPLAGCVGGVAAPCTADAISAVKSYASNNYGVTAAEWTSCTNTLPSGYVGQGGTSCIAFNNSGVSPTAILVRMPTRNVRTAFAGVIGRAQVPVSSSAEAQLGTEIKCTLCFLGSVEARNADFTVTGGSIAVNGNVEAGPNSYWTSSSNGVVGTVNGGVFTPATTTISPFGDPLASMSLPLSDPTHTVKTGTPCANGPGIYNNAITLGNNVTCTLTAGLYVINNEWLIGNNTVVQGSGVTIYVPGPNGYLNWKNGYTDISAPTTGTFKDLVIVYARDNTNPFSIQGNGAMKLVGAVYLKNSDLDFNGNSCFTFQGGPVVAAGVQLANGNQSCITITSPREQTVTRTDLFLSQ